LIRNVVEDVSGMQLRATPAERELKEKLNSKKKKRKRKLVSKPP